MSRASAFRDASDMASTSSHRELNHRTSDGIDVWLLWDPATDGISVRVSDKKAGAAFEIPVKARHRAMDVFHHPFAYAA
jgi:hypothetical protein